nr:tape measure protein [uncultured Ligilactobacillus sp.]
MADGKISIEFDIPVEKVHSDTELINNYLSGIGKDAGSEMDRSFSDNADEMVKKSQATSNEIDQTLGKEHKTKITADGSNAENEIKKIDEKYRQLPKNQRTKLEADAKEAGITDFRKFLAKIPDKKRTEILAKAEKGEVIDFNKEIKSLPKKVQTEVLAKDNASDTFKKISKTAEETGNKFSHLKEIIVGSFAGNLIAGAAQGITDNLKDITGEAVESSDAIDKFKSTMKLGGFGEKEIGKATKEVQKYANETVYDLSDVSNTTAQLAANGIKNYMQLTEAAGNLNAQAGGTKDTFKSVAMVLTQTAGAGKLTTENWNQLADAIPGASGVLQKAMKENGAYTGNFRDAMANGQITADEFNKAITQLGMNDGAKKAAASTKTFEGALGNLRANAVTAIQGIIDTLGKSHLTDIINGISDQIPVLANRITKVLGSAVDYLYSKKFVLSEIGSNLRTLVGIIGNTVWKTFIDFAYNIADALGLVDDKGSKAKDPLDKINDLLKSLVNHKTEIENLTKALMAFFAIKKATEFLGVMQKLLSVFGSLGKIKLPSLIFGAGEASAGAGGAAMLKGLLKKTPIIAGATGVATELFSKDSLGGKIGGSAGSVGGTALGAAIGSAILPGIGTALGASAGAWVGQKFGSGFGNSIQKELKGHPVTASVKVKPDIDSKAINKSLQPTIKKLNKQLLLKMGVDSKSIKETQKQTDKLFKNMNKTVDNYYNNKEKKAKKDLDTLVKNGALTQKEADKRLKQLKKNDDKERKDKKAAYGNLQKDLDQHQKNVEKIENTHYKSEKAKQKDLDKEHKRFVNQYVQDEFKAQTNITKDVDKGAKEQKSIYEKLVKDRGKLSVQDLDSTKKNADKIYQESTKSARKTRDDVVKAANEKYRDTVDAAKRQRDDTHSISDDQYKKIVAKAKQQRDDTKDAAEDQYKKVTKSATDQHTKTVKEINSQKKEVTDAALAQAGAHAGAATAEMNDVNTNYDSGFSSFRTIWNGIIGGINSVLNALHKGWGNIPKMKAHAKGTAGTLTDEIALVGEEGFELAHDSINGIYPVGVNGPEIRHLPAGTSILPHGMSKQFMAMANTIPHHKDGVKGWITDAFDWAKEKIEDVEDFVSKGAGHVWEWIQDKLGIDSFVKKYIEAPAQHSFMDGTIQMGKDKVTEFFKGKFDKYNEENSKSGGFGKAPDLKNNAELKDVVKNALKANGLPTSSEWVNAWLRQIATESGGNAHAVQPGADPDGDGSGPAIGLLQTKRATFNANAFPGHKDIFNAYDNALAAIHYAKNRYGNSMLSVIGHGHGYALGGHILSPEIALIGEDGDEFVVNTNKETADELLESAIKQRASINPNSTSALLAKVIDSANNSHFNGYGTVPNYVASNHGSVKLSNSSNDAFDGDLIIDVNLDSNKIANATYSKYKAMQSRQITIAQNGGAIPVV